MLPPVPLFPGVPGGIEVFIVLLILVVPLGLLAVVAAVFGFGVLQRGSSNDGEVERLERRVEELERQQNDADRTRDADRSGWNDGQN